MTSSSTLRSLAIAVVVMSPHMLAAQTQPANLPASLAGALIGISQSSLAVPKFFVGEAPTGFPAALIPRHPVSVIGGMKVGDQLIVVLSDSTRRLAAVYEQLLLDSGWTRPPAPRASGFTSASGPYSFFCRDSTMVSPEPLMGPSRDFIRVTYQVRHGSGYCAGFGEAPTPPGELVLPALLPPKGLTVTSGGGGSGGNGVNARAQLVGQTMTVNDVLAHYGKQLVAAGWTAGAPGIGDRVAVQRLEAHDQSGAAWTGVLLAVVTDTGVSMSLTMSPRSKQ